MDFVSPLSASIIFFGTRFCALDIVKPTKQVNGKWIYLMDFIRVRTGMNTVTVRSETSQQQSGIKHVFERIILVACQPNITTLGGGVTFKLML